MEIALRGVKPFRVADPFARRQEMRMSRFVRPHLLRGDHEIEVDSEMFSRLGDEVIVDVRQDAEADAGAAETLE